MNIGGKTMLEHHINRLRQAKTLDEIVVATTTNGQDDVLEELCAEKGWLYFRGSEDDVLDRYYQAATKFKAKIVVRVTSDCPLIEPVVLDRTVEKFQRNKQLFDYVSNSFPNRTYPRGLDTEVFSYQTLERIWQDDEHRESREHVTPYIHRNSHLFKIHCIQNEVDLSHHRWTVDTAEDLQLVRKIYDHFRHDRFSWQDILGVLEKHPEWLEINKNIRQKEIHIASHQ